jgi:Zn-dependent protease with chaperone function
MAHLLFGVDVEVNFFRFCISLFKEQSFYYFLVTFFLNAFIAYTVLLTFFKTAEQIILTKRLKAKLAQFKHDELTEHINLAFNRNKDEILVIENDQSLAFTIGFIKPSIVLSTRLLKMLDKHELEAVIQHEAYHQRNYDSLKIFLLQVISQGLWFIPLTKWSYLNYKIISEVLADKYAIKKTGSELGLSSALVKFIKHGFKQNSKPVLVHFSAEAVNFRLQQLVSPKNAIPVSLNKRSVLVSIHVLLFLMSLIYVAII